MPDKPARESLQRPNVHMSMSPAARTRMRSTEKEIHHYYNDMGKTTGNCTWGAGILAHKGVCSSEELGIKVNAKMVGLEFERRVLEAKRAVRRKISVPLDQEQFDALCSLTYNAGPSGSRGTYGYVNRGDFAGAANNISTMIKVSITKNGKKKYVIAPGLIIRRAEESAPFRLKEKPANAIK
jgi:lysozyme